MFQLTPSDADLFWYLSRGLFLVGVSIQLAIVSGLDPVPSTSLDFLLGILLLAAVPAVEWLSDSTPLHEELDLVDD